MPEFTPPKVSAEIIVEFPKPHVLLVTFNRPKSLNAFTPQMLEDLRQLLNWFEDEPELWVVVFTGAGRIFSAGADLKAWDRNEQTGKRQHSDSILTEIHGFGSVSRRVSKKPFIAAVNGSTYGGGTEFIINCDLVVASKDATFALPEVKRGVVAIQGAIPRLSRIAGHQLASEMLLLGDPIKADDARNRFGFVNVVVPTADVLPTALDLAEKITANSPDSIQSTKTGLLLAQNHPTEVTVALQTRSQEHQGQMLGDNVKEGLRAFNEKRPPAWKNAGTRSKL
ncbi:enoyl-CoA hydratase/carnithine racemase [Mycena amicta]|nr:enoyl-CoA hydratase/carnithine racemase [Mycena amicta]